MKTTSTIVSRTFFWSFGLVPSWPVSMYDFWETRGIYLTIKIYFPDHQHHWVLHVTPGDPGIHCFFAAEINPKCSETAAYSSGSDLVYDIVPNSDEGPGFLDKEVLVFISDPSLLHLSGLVCDCGLILSIHSDICIWTAIYLNELSYWDIITSK